MAEESGCEISMGHGTALLQGVEKRLELRFIRMVFDLPGVDHVHGRVPVQVLIVGMHAQRNAEMGPEIFPVQRPARAYCRYLHPLYVLQGPDMRPPPPTPFQPRRRKTFS